LRRYDGGGIALNTWGIHRPKRARIASAGITLATALSLMSWLALGSGHASADVLALCGNAGTAPPIKHVVVVMLENQSYSQVMGNADAPYQTALASQCGVGTAMFAATHTSAANYLAMSAGEYPATSPPGCGSVGACADSASNLYHQLDSAGLSWNAFMESMPSACAPSSGGAYKIGHNPVLFYSNISAGECQANDLPVSDLTAQSGAFWNDLQNQTLPSFSLISPNLNNDGESSGGSGAQLLAADTWLQAFIGLVQQSASYQAGNTVVLVAYDEGRGSDTSTGEDCTNESLDLPVTNGVSAHRESCHVPLFVVYPYTPAGSQDGTFFDHYSITKTVEDIFGLPYLGHAGDAQTSSLLGHFGLPVGGTSPSPSPSPTTSPSTSPSSSPSPSQSSSPSPSPSPSPSTTATSCPPTPGGSTELSGNVSLETGQAGWTGLYTSGSAVTRIQPGGGSYDGSWALHIAPKSGTSGTAGVNNANPIWVPGSPGVSTTAGATYAGSAVVQGSVAGETVSLLVRETTSSGSGVGYHTTTLTLPDTAWHQISSAYTAKTSGDLIRYSLYVSNFASSSQNLLADCFSLRQ
jgi:hypothetical protein